MSNTYIYDKPPCDHAALRRILGPGRFRRGSMRTRRPMTPAYQCPPGGTTPSQAAGRRTGYRPNVFTGAAHGATRAIANDDRAADVDTSGFDQHSNFITPRAADSETHCSAALTFGWPCVASRSRGSSRQQRHQEVTRASEPRRQSSLGGGAVQAHIEGACEIGGGAQAGTKGWWVQDRPAWR